jgi:DNA-binding winged helix-turn-helix (wHTH) protein
MVALALTTGTATLAPARGSRKSNAVTALIPNELRMPITAAITSLGAVVTYEDNLSAPADTLLLEVGSENAKRHGNFAKYLSDKTTCSKVGLASWAALRTGQLEIIEGIDDLILYPIETSELKYRLKRYIQAGDPDVSDNGGLMQFGNLAFNLQLSLLTINGKKLSFTGKEFALLLYLARQNERPVGHIELGSQALKIPSNYPTILNTVNVHIARVRAKLRAESLGDVLATIKNEGFILRQKMDFPAAATTENG